MLAFPVPAYLWKWPEALVYRREVDSRQERDSAKAQGPWGLLQLTVVLGQEAHRSASWLILAVLGCTSLLTSAKANSLIVPVDTVGQPRRALLLLVVEAGKQLCPAT